MKGLLTLLVAGSTAFACVGSGTGPDVPTGLTVTLSTVTTTPVLPASASITGAGDSVAAVVVRAATCGKTTTADAGMQSGRLIITITQTAFAVQVCDPINGSTTYRAVAHGLAPARYDVSADFRYVFGSTVSDSTLATASLVLP